mgnify:CR=1 FL=1
MAENQKTWLYLRAGTKQDMESQKARLMDFAKEAGYEVTDVAADYPPSWSSMNLARLAAASQDYEVLLVSSWKRLGTDLFEMIDTMTFLKDHGVTVRSADERDVSLEEALSIAQIAAILQLTNEPPPENPDESES